MLALELKHHILLKDMKTGTEWLSYADVKEKKEL
jgi:hypothetical protein